MRVLISVFAVSLACVSTGFTKDSKTFRVLEIRCENTPLDENNKCPKIVRTGALLEFIVSATTQNIQMTVLKNDGNWLIKSTIIKSCHIVDTNNWECGNVDTIIKEIQGMRHGHYYRKLLGGGSPDFYTSSIGGWTLRTYEIGAMSLEQAQKMD